ncbi:AmmeMemoRadiSam system radical SAM enzyme [Dictyobacter sp. S3.2.2.5]|uniref:AmmeMemoRadiSam system radical SAM enzyme n=1 Tax=Dictyobacter halimunensis TaxID=3026934 RepID=A0ABQ6FJQ2_9CHLR|nr:AmmeMemoRadiSam system radical SAM enzyme [Dictyobacter sp. S3.2.2.5]
MNMEKGTLWLDEPAVHSGVIYRFDTRIQHVESTGTRCLACTRRCLLHERQVGYCSAVVNWRQQLYSTGYGVIGEAGVTPIEQRPVYHYRPGTRTLALGGLGCNLRCAFCQNWEIAFRDVRHGASLTAPNVSPEYAIELALEQRCSGLVWTFNEPSIAPMYVYNSARLAHEAGLYTVFVTNGFLTEQALRLLGPYIDVYRIDIKSLDAHFYRQVAATSANTEMLPLARLAQQEFGIHVETVTNIMPTLNDQDEHLSRLADQIVRYLGPGTPWHLTTYVPYAHMKHIPATPPATILRARDLGLAQGLHFVYTDVLEAPETMHTFCPQCQTLIIERSFDQVLIHELTSDGRCVSCGYDLGIVMTVA